MEKHTTNVCHNHFYNEDELEKVILQHCIAGSIYVILFYAVHDSIVGNFKALLYSALALMAYTVCYAFSIWTKKPNISKRIVVSIVILSLVFGFFNLGGLFGIIALNLCGLTILISAVFSGIERRIFTCLYLIVILFFVWIHLFHKNWISDYRASLSEVFLITETLIYISFILYIGYLYKSQYEKKRVKAFETYKELEDANAEISAQNDYIISNNNQLKALVEGIWAEQNKVLETNIKLKQANLEIARQNKYITTINTELESIIAERTKDIRDLNQRIIHFAQYNAHRIRGPLARIIGLVNVMKIDFLVNKSLTYEQSEFYIESLRQNSCELDEMVRRVSILLSEE